MNCPLCETALRERADEEFFICAACGAYVKDAKFYLSPETELEEYEKHENDANDPEYQKFTSPVREAVQKFYNSSHLGLDYGCGNAPVISEMLRKKDYQLKLFDPFFFPDMSYMNYRYDYIFCCEVFEHFHQPKSELDKLIKLLQPNGRLIIMTQLYDGGYPFKNWHYRRDPTHVFIASLKTIHYIAAIYALSLEKQEERLLILRK